MAMRLHGTSTKYICLSSTLSTSLLVLWGEEVPYNLTQVVSDTPGGTSVFGETITTFYKSTQLDNGKPNTQVLQTHFPIPFHVFPTTLSLRGTNSPRRRKTKSQTC